MLGMSHSLMLVTIAKQYWSIIQDGKFSALFLNCIWGEDPHLLFSETREFGKREPRHTEGSIVQAASDAQQGTRGVH